MELIRAGAGFASLKVAVSLLAAYTLVYFRVKGATAIFSVLLLTLMLPLESGSFRHTMWSPNWVGQHGGRADLPAGCLRAGNLVFPAVPSDRSGRFAESARLDGAGSWKFFKDILLPLSAPTAAALFLVLFVNGWNQYLWPVMVTSEEATYTLVRGMQFFGRASLPGLMLAMLAIVPPCLLVILFQRQVVKDCLTAHTRVRDRRLEKDNIRMAFEAILLIATASWLIRN